MTLSTLFQTYHSIPAATTNTNVAVGTNTTLSGWNSLINSSTQIIHNVSNGTPKSSFQSLDGTSITINTSGGSLTLSGGSVSGNIVSFKQLEAASLSGSQKTTINGVVNFNSSTNEISGTYTSLLYQAGLTTLAPYSYKFSGEIIELGGTIKGSVTSVERTAYFDSTINVTLTENYTLKNALVGMDYVNDTWLLSNSTLVSGYGSIGKDKTGSIVIQNNYESFLPVNANVINVFESIMSGDDTIILSGNGAKTSNSGFAGNDKIIGDAGDNYFNNKVESSKFIFRGLGNDTLDGGAGYDVVYFGSNKLTGTYAFSNFDAINNSFIVTDTLPLNNTGVDTLIGIEELQFGDKTFTSTVRLQMV